LSFLTWAALGIAALVVAPLIAHLLRRRPPEEMPFAATKLVPARTAVAQRRTAIEDRALFTIRALAVLALAILGATPFVTCQRLSLAREGGASVALTIVLDDSLSMRAALDAAGGTTRFDRAKAAAAELLTGLAEGDAVAVVLAGSPPRVALAATSNVDAARRLVAEAGQTDRGTDLSAAVDLAAELLSDLQHVDKRVVVLSDLADGGTEALTPPDGVKLWAPLEELRGARANCAVIAADRVGDKIASRIACAAGEPTEGIKKRKIAILAGDRVIDEAPLSLAPGTEDVVMRLPTDAKIDDTVRLTVALVGEADAIAADDRAPVVAIGGQLQVGVVSDPASSGVVTGGPPAVEQAYRALSLGVQLRPLSAVPDRGSELSELGVLIVDDVPGFTPSQRRELAAWVEKGGVLMIALGPGAAAAPLGSSFEPMLPAIVKWSSNAPAGIDPERDGMFGESGVGLDKLSAKGRAELDLAEEGAPKRVVAWKDGAPFLLEKRMGRGLVYVATLPFDTDRSDFALRPGFLHLLKNLVDAARTLGGVARTDVGATWTFDGYDEVAVQRVDDQDRVERVAVSQAPTGRSRRVVVDWAGWYELELDGNQATRVAAVVAEEVDLRPRPAADDATADALGGVTASVDVSSYIAIALLFLLFAELAVRALAPGRKAPEETGPVSSAASS
jgi:von Willebrand factor type A domain/Aerotolerance regulator N-terminal